MIAADPAEFSFNSNGHEVPLEKVLAWVDQVVLARVVEVWHGSHQFRVRLEKIYKGEMDPEVYIRCTNFVIVERPTFRVDQLIFLCGYGPNIERPGDMVGRLVGPPGSEDVIEFHGDRSPYRFDTLGQVTYDGTISRLPWPYFEDVVVRTLAQLRVKGDAPPNKAV